MGIRANSTVTGGGLFQITGNGAFTNLNTFATGSIADVDDGGGHLIGTTTNHGTFNVNANLTFSYGSLINHGTVVFTGSSTIGIYAAAEGIRNHGTVVKPPTSTGTFTLNLRRLHLYRRRPLHNSIQWPFCLQYQPDLH